MRKIELVKGIQSSVLGFGCAPVMGAIGAGRAKRALHCALDNGINHFDLAKSYGFGEAERFVGKVLKGRRNDVVLVSKFGIVANWKARMLKPVKPLVRSLKQMLKPAHGPATTDPIRNAADRFHDRLPIDAAHMIKSLNESLKQLDTDHLDHFMIHEPTSTITMLDDLLSAASKLKEQGKIRSFGLAFNRADLPQHYHYLNKFDILQFDHPLDSDDLATQRADSANILFSVMRGKQPGVSYGEQLKAVNQQFPKSVLLCSMFSENHIIENARLFS